MIQNDSNRFKQIQKNSKMRLFEGISYTVMKKKHNLQYDKTIFLMVASWFFILGDDGKKDARIGH